jgi:uroporphyrinogen decarboxylase
MSILTNCLINKDTSCVPVWFMRQAGRYLPEFKLIRTNNPDFIKLCLDSKLSAEITLQPIIRYDLDAAIIFSDILILPFAANQSVEFKTKTGPSLSNFVIDKFLSVTDEEFTKKLEPVYKAITLTRKKLSRDKSLISFVGSPWTLVVYMFGLKVKKNILNLDLFTKKKREINIILSRLNQLLCLHIKNQMNSGADTVQLFDSWAGLLPNDDLGNFCYKPNKELVNFCKKNKYPVICFPKGINKNVIEFIKMVSPDCLSIDYNVDPGWVRNNIEGICIQGGMDPKILLEEEEKIFLEAAKYLKIFKNYPYIFNLGHGLLPETSPDKLGNLIKFIKEKR